ncbi:alpha/beta fold hydrolase [Methylobacterium soli]|uniref:Alpha/beta fold hydrolase n=1 Tax=Methylobacterium soli TaxID=553447 RepID=A0A6L3T5H2_9HYPH|nr:alpha/beta fold hydrolase [Methylobacterium soli]
MNAYVSWFRPARARDVSVTFVHGGGGQGSEFLSTPDGRPGWVHAFLRAGFPVFVLDRPGHGRSHWREEVLGAALPPPSYEALHPRFVEPARHGGWPEAARHAQWPDHDPEAGDRFMASQGVMATTLAAAQRHVEAIGPDLFALTGRTVLVSHSAGGPCGWALAAIGGDAVAAILAVEPLGHPGLRHPLGTFADGLCAETPAGRHDPFGRPIAILTGEASWMRATNARAAAFLRERGCDVAHLLLEEHGLRGNGHMMMSEKNSDAVAALMISVLDRMLRPASAGSSGGNKRARSPDTET